MSELIDNEKVVAVFGPTNSGNAMAWKHIANQKKIPVIGNVGSGTDITKPMSPGADNYMFRVSMVDREQVAALMAYVKKNAATSKVVGLMAETTGYGQGGLKDMEEIAKLQGIKIAATERFGVGDTDMTSQLSKMKAAGVDTVVVWAQGTPIAQLVRSMEKINYFPLVADLLGRRQHHLLRRSGQDAGGKADLHAHRQRDAHAGAAEALRPRRHQAQGAGLVLVRAARLRLGAAAMPPRSSRPTAPTARRSASRWRT